MSRILLATWHLSILMTLAGDATQPKDAPPSKEAPAPPSAETRADKNPQAANPESPFVQDLRDLGSANEGINAADRIFKRIPFVGMSKEQVLWLLGDPQKINRFGLAAGAGADDPLIYRVSSGAKFMDWAVLFKDGKVLKVERRASY